MFGIINGFVLEYTLGTEDTDGDKLNVFLFIYVYDSLRIDVFNKG